LGEGDAREVPLVAASRFATSSLVPRVEARARWTAASPPARRSQELSGGGCNPVDEPTPLSPRLIAGLSSSASAGPIGCTSGLDAPELGREPCALDFGVLRDLFGLLGCFAIAGIWDDSGCEKRAKAGDGDAGRFAGQFARQFDCQQLSAVYALIHEDGV
jgi:hypothetical protein